MSAFYRDKLSNRNNSEAIKPNKIYEFEIKKVKRFNFIRKLIAMVQHPDNAIKIATWLAIISILLSLFSLLGLMASYL